jgi:hypothetical protein
MSIFGWVMVSASSPSDGFWKLSSSPSTDSSAWAAGAGARAASKALALSRAALIAAWAPRAACFRRFSSSSEQHQHRSHAVKSRGCLTIVIVDIRQGFSLIVQPQLLIGMLGASGWWRVNCRVRIPSLRLGSLDLLADEVRVQLRLREQEVELPRLSLGLSGFFLGFRLVESFLLGLLPRGQLVLLVLPPVQEHLAKSAGPKSEPYCIQPRSPP